jgi:hypothetical protein
MAGSGGPVEFFVDVEEVGRLRSELQTLLAELDGLPTQDGMNADATALGGGDVAGAVDRFAVTWTDGRARITENLGECRALAEGAIAAYTSAETSIQNAAAAPAGPATREDR